MAMPPPLSVVYVKIQAHVVERSKLLYCTACSGLNSSLSLDTADMTIEAHAPNSYCNNMVHEENTQGFILFTV
jgi:hypothetical protein